MTRQCKFNEAILEATDQLMESDPSVYVMGLGVPDEKGIFGTTLDLHKKYGVDRALDMPTAENGMTGIAIGSAINGMRPIMTHQRVDFFLLALDQLINNASKWYYMFDGKMSVPMVIRLIIGRGWGQGPQHSQSLHNIFGHIPGLKVVMPSNAYDAKGLLVSSVRDDNPVVYIEHRWLHNIYGDVPKELYEVPIGKAKVAKEGKDITVVGISHMTLEAFKALPILEKENLSVELIDVRTINPLDKETILESVKKTGRLVVLDPDWKTGGFSSEIISSVTEEGLDFLKEAPLRICYPDRLSPSSWRLANEFYPTSTDIAIQILQKFKKQTKLSTLLEDLMQKKSEKPLDTPDPSFTGPF